jgi:cytochrome c2
MNDAAKRSIQRLCVVLIVVAQLAACVHEREYEPRVHAGDAERGKAALARLECGACHIIPGIPGAVGQVGPTLDAYAKRSYVAGKFPNEPETLVRFMLDPPSMAPLTAMPAIEMSDRDARDIAAYLYELE